MYTRNCKESDCKLEMYEHIEKSTDRIRGCIWYVPVIPCCKKKTFWYNIIVSEQKCRKRTPPGDGCQAAEAPPCTSWLNNKGIQSHDSLWKCFFRPLQWCSSWAESSEDLVDRQKAFERKKERKKDGKRKRSLVDSVRSRPWNFRNRGGGWIGRDLGKRDGKEKEEGM